MKLKEIEILAQEVYAVLGTDHEETVYHMAMQIGFRDAGERYETEKGVSITFRGLEAGRGRADLVLSDLVIELKARKKIDPGDMRQLQCYMTGLKISRGMLINFATPSGNNPAKLEIKYIGVEVAESQE